MYEGNVPQFFPCSPTTACLMCTTIRQQQNRLASEVFTEKNDRKKSRTKKIYSRHKLDKKKNLLQLNVKRTVEKRENFKTNTNTHTRAHTHTHTKTKCCDTKQTDRFHIQDFCP